MSYLNLFQPSPYAFNANMQNGEKKKKRLWVGRKPQCGWCPMQVALESARAQIHVQTGSLSKIPLTDYAYVCF